MRFDRLTTFPPHLLLPSQRWMATVETRSGLLLRAISGNRVIDEDKCSGFYISTTKPKSWLQIRCYLQNVRWNSRHFSISCNDGLRLVIQSPSK
jgi:hypothetical protein